MAIVPASDAGDDDRAARDARSAQQRFERVRRAHLPRTRGGGGTSPCDARVGRFCYWYDSTETIPDPEPRRIIQARLDLLAVLDSAAALSPADPWIAGQRVRYYVEAGKLNEALAVARACRAELWWCSSLAGLVHHVSQEYVAADSAFGGALRAMPDTQRCEWFDLRTIADPRWDRSFRDASCSGRERLARRAFTLGRPLWMVDGSDLRSEHFARHTMALIHARSANAHGISFGDDSRELLLRYGWPEWFTRHELSPAAFTAVAVTGQEREPAYYFFPDVAGVETARPGPDSWTLRGNPVPSRYAPRHVERMTTLPHQLARFIRGDSMLIVARFSIADAILERDGIASALSVLRGDSVRVIARSRDRWIAGMAVNDALIAGVEVLGDSTKHAARARYAIAPLACGGWCLSDLLVIDPTRVDSTAGPVDAARAAHPDLRVPGNAAVGVYFELTPPASGASARPASFSLTVTPIRVSIARRIAASLRLADRPEAVRMRWEEVVGAAGARPARSIALRIPPAARGRYRLQLTVTPRGGDAMTASRELEIAR